MPRKSYAEKLKDPRWQKKRLQILERDNWACVDCGKSDQTLHVHHKTYLKNFEPWEHPDETLETLCCDCHDEKEILLAEARECLGAYKLPELREIVNKLLDLAAVAQPGWGFGLAKAMHDYHSKGPEAFADRPLPSEYER